MKPNECPFGCNGYMQRIIMNKDDNIQSQMIKIKIKPTVGTNILSHTIPHYNKGNFIIFYFLLNLYNQSKFYDIKSWLLIIHRLEENNRGERG